MVFVQQLNGQTRLVNCTLQLSPAQSSLERAQSYLAARRCMIAAANPVGGVSGWIVASFLATLQAYLYIEHGTSVTPVAHTLECAEEITEVIRLTRAHSWWRFFALLAALLVVALTCLFAGLLWTGTLCVRSAVVVAHRVRGVVRAPTVEEQRHLDRLRSRHGMLQDR